MNKKISTTCSYCGVGCGIDVTLSHNNDIIDFYGNKNNPVNKGMLCSKGLNLHYVVKDTSDRLLKPQARFSKSYQLQDISWDMAFKRGAAVFKTMIEKYGSDSVGMYVSGQLLTEEYYIANKLCKGFFATNNIDTNSRLCMSSAVAAYKKSIGDDAPPISYDDIENCDCFFITGANPSWCHPIIFRRIEAQLTQKNARLIVVDPRKTETAQIANLHLKIKAGTDIELYNAIASLLFQLDYADKEFLIKNTNGWQATKKFLEKIDIKQSSKICDIPIEQIYEAVHIIGKSKTLLTMWSMGLNQSSMGVDKNLTLINLNLITGKIGRIGCGPFSLTGQPNAMGGREVGGLANLLAAHHDLSNPKHRKKIANFWGSKEINSAPGLTATEMIDAIEEGKLKALWIVCTNPAVSLPNLAKVKRALKKIPFLIVSEISNKADTIEYADLIFPAAGWLEKEGTMTNSERRISYLPKGVDPPGEALPDVKILCKFAQAMGFVKQFSYANTEEIFNEHRDLTKGTNIDISGISYERLKKQSIQWPCPSSKDLGTSRLFIDKQFFTLDKKARLFPIKYKESSEKLTKELPFILTTGRLRDQWHTMTRTGKVNKLKLHSPRPLLEIHSKDAKRLNINSQELVQIYNQRGTCEALVSISNSIKEGTLFLPMHWQNSFNRGKNCTNNLTNDLVDPVSKEPEFKFSAVNIAKITPRQKKIIIIGAGAAALEFVQKYREKNIIDKIIIFGNENHGFYNRILLPEYINGEKKWDDLKTTPKNYFKQKNISFKKGVLVESIDTKKKIIKTSNNIIETYDKLIIATGSSSSIPILKTQTIQGVFTLRSRNDADSICEHIQKYKDAVIVGGGLLGLELAGSLASLGIKVTIIQRSSRLMRGQIDEIGGKILHTEITNRNIEIIYNEEVSEIIGKESIEYIKLGSGKIISCKSLFFAVGIKPNIKIAIKAKLKCSRGIIINKFLQTSNSDIYAIGECAEQRGTIYGTTAAAQEQAQALVNIFHGDYSQPYNGSLNFNILKINNLNLCSMGTTSIYDNSYEEIIIIDEKLCYYKKCIIKDDRLVGAILIGDKSEFSKFKNLIKQKFELGEERKRLLRNSTNKSEALGKLICICNNIGEINIIEAIKNGCDNFEKTCIKTNAGTGCGSCRPEVKKIFDLTMKIKECEIRL